MKASFSRRLTLALAALLLGYGALVAVLGRQVAAQYEQESLQRLSHGLARHIVEHWPQITVADRDQADSQARAALMSMLMVVNPGVQVYVLDADGAVANYIGEPGMVRQHRVDLNAVRDFLGGAALPLRGTDPMAEPGSGAARIFSAAMFAPRPGDTRPPGYLYVVLDSQVRDLVSGQLSPRRAWMGAALALAAGLLVTLGLGIFHVRRLSRPLHQLARRMHAYSASGDVAAPPKKPVRDEVQAIAEAFAQLTQRIESQAARERQQSSAHREMMASVAHDLRTPLTALHGHLEALSTEPARHARVLALALAQSNKVRRLSQQLFELAALQASDQVLHRERFSLDELVTDAVQKFEFIDPQPGYPPRVTLSGAPPGRLELTGDLQLIERALTNLIDNALRHAPGDAPVRVSLQREGGQAQIWVEDNGPGLPADLRQRLQRNESVRDTPLRRAGTAQVGGMGGGIGGLGLAIAQRVAVLHGGSLRPLPAPAGGTRLCLALPMGL